MLSERDVIGFVHLGSAVLSLISGFLVAVVAKGTGLHRRLGWSYFVAMVVVNGTAFMIYDLFSGFGPFHVAALVSGVTVLLGFIPARRRKPKRLWIAHHAYWMAWSYVGLCAAAVSEISTRYLAVPFGLTVGIATLSIVGIGSILINRNVPRILKDRFGIDVADASSS